MISRVIKCCINWIALKIMIQMFVHFQYRHIFPLSTFDSQLDESISVPDIEAIHREGQTPFSFLS